MLKVSNQKGLFVLGAWVIPPEFKLRDAHIFRYVFLCRALDGFCFA